MILDRLQNGPRYEPLHRGFAKAFRFLSQAKAARLPLGRREVDGDRIYAVVAAEVARARDAAVLEAHRRYIDIQCVLAGIEEIGWQSRARCGMPREAYDARKDLEFFEGRPAAWVTLQPGDFAIFFPEDAHAPLVGAGELRKIVVKVRA